MNFFTLRVKLYFSWADTFSMLLLFSHSAVSDSAIPWTAACKASLSFSVSQWLLKLMFIESVMPSNHLILCHPLLLLPSIFPSIRVFSNESALHIRWPKYWSFSFNISPSNECSGLISFRMDWFDLFPYLFYACCMLRHFNWVWFFVTLWTIACQAPLSMGVSRQEYWRWLPCPPSEDLPNPGIKPTSPAAPALQPGSLLLDPQGSSSFP